MTTPCHTPTPCPECATCNLWEKRKGYCGFKVVEGLGKCNLVDEAVGFGEGYVSPFAGEGEE
jgi:hypothetical protein